MGKDLNMDVRVYPIKEPKGSTAAFARVTFCVDDEQVNAITGIRVIDGKNGLFVSMPQTQNKDGDYHDIAFPVMKGLRGNINKAIVAEYDNALKDGPGAGEPHLYYGGKLPENGAGEISVDANMKPVSNPRGKTMAFGSVTFRIDGRPFSVIENVRVMDSKNGLFVSMPQTQNKDGDYRDIAFPVMKGLRGQVIEAVFESYERAAADRNAGLDGIEDERYASVDEYSEAVAGTEDKAVGQPEKTAVLTTLEFEELLTGNPPKALPDNITVGGSLRLSGTSITALPDNLTVNGWLDLRGTQITALPDNLTVRGDLNIRGTPITKLPDNLKVEYEIRSDPGQLEKPADRPIDDKDKTPENITTVQQDGRVMRRTENIPKNTPVPAEKRGVMAALNDAKKELEGRDGDNAQPTRPKSPER
jgi:DNA-binding cell septation regulator SpoVG